MEKPNESDSVLSSKYQPEKPPIIVSGSQAVKSEEYADNPAQSAASSSINPPAENAGYVEVDKNPKTDSDRPSGLDRLNYSRYAEAFANIILNYETNTPITIGIYGQWGQGKSFLMGKIQEALEPENERKKLRRRTLQIMTLAKNWVSIQNYWISKFRTHSKHYPFKDLVQEIRERKVDPLVGWHIVNFNAWSYVGTEHLWAGLVTRLYEEAEKYFGLELVLARLLRAFKRSLPRSLFIFAFYALIGMGISVAINSPDIAQSFGSLAIATRAFLVSVLGGAGLAGLPALWATLKGFADNLFLTRSANLQNLVARPDFKSRIGIMADIKEEISFIGELLGNKKGGKQNRFILFIDDLDRCDHKKAVEVLQAIMLLLTDEDGAPFIIFLGLDARVLVRAIEANYGDVLVKAGINGYEYLDKIVQIPFVIPKASDKDIAQYVDSLLWSSKEEKDLIIRKMGQQPTKPTPPTPEEIEKHKKSLVERILGAPIEVILSSFGYSSSHEPEKIPTMFTEPERDALMLFTKDLTENPRKIKRIINIYRFTRQLFPPPLDRMKAIRWVMLTEQWPFHMAWVLEEVENDVQTKTNKWEHKTILDVYAQIKPNIFAKEAESLLAIDADPDIFDQFINANPVFSVTEIKELVLYTFNLNPAIRSEVSKQAVRLMQTKLQTSDQVSVPKTISTPQTDDKPSVPKTLPVLQQAV